jgi:hypothetical protein
MDALGRTYTGVISNYYAENTEVQTYLTDFIRDRTVAKGGERSLD